eukprot:934943_1
MQITSVDEDVFHVEVLARKPSKDITKLFIKQSHKPSAFRRITIGQGEVSGGIDIDIDSDEKHDESGCVLTLYETKRPPKRISHVDLRLRLVLETDEQQLPPYNLNYRPNCIDPSTVIQRDDMNNECINIYWTLPPKSFGDISYRIIHISYDIIHENREDVDATHVSSLPYLMPFSRAQLMQVFRVVTVAKVNGKVYQSEESKPITVRYEDGMCCGCDWLTDELDKVIKKINHEMDSRNHFLFQVYSMNWDDESEIQKCVTYAHDEAMNHYRQTIAQEVNTSMLCNGKNLYESGDSELCQRCSNEAEEDYNRVLSGFQCKKLNYSDIIKKWKGMADRYDQKWLLSVKRNTFIEVAISFFGVTIIQNAMKLYDRLIQNVIFNRLTERDKKKYMSAHALKQQIKKGKREMCSDPMFLWTKKTADIVHLDDTHFLYVSALILDTLKREFEHVEMGNILRCLEKMKINGRLFKKLDGEHRGEVKATRLIIS